MGDDCAYRSAIPPRRRRYCNAQDEKNARAALQCLSELVFNLACQHVHAGIWSEFLVRVGAQLYCVALPLPFMRFDHFYSVG